jgi:hypothetical protein
LLRCKTRCATYPSDFKASQAGFTRSEHFGFCDPVRRFAALQQFRRFREEADIQQAALTKPDL